ncbi:MAG: hypothetical protein CVT82_02235 [Alphaproteobacteria bacterium HGW-Alphaproteobacteria-4]|jgi:hypothetical protein|nr:MAG: hypothetical protein CVT82_02235 [Alphaproteobacteria bacterium HGW-Alphaproteobacteria-4]
MALEKDILAINTPQGRHHPRLRRAPPDFANSADRAAKPVGFDLFAKLCGRLMQISANFRRSRPAARGNILAGIFGGA